MLVRLAPFIFVCIWATGFIGARLGMPFSEPGTFLSIRFVIALLLLGALAMVMRVPWPGRVNASHAIIIGALIHGVYLGAVFWSIDHGMPAGVSAVIVGLQPLLTAVLAGWFLGEIITRRNWIGLAIGLAGVILVLAPKIDVSDSGVNGFTIAASLTGMVSVTVGTILQKHWGGAMDLRSGTALQYLGAVIPVAFLSLFTETREIIWSAEMIVAMIWSIFVLSIGAIFLLMWLIQQGSVARLSSVFFLVPGVASLMAFFLFDERLVPMQLVGMALCALGVALATARPNVRRLVTADKV